MKNFDNYILGKNTNKMKCFDSIEKNLNFQIRLAAGSVMELVMSPNNREWLSRREIMDSLINTCLNDMSSGDENTRISISLMENLFKINADVTLAQCPFSISNFHLLVC